MTFEDLRELLLSIAEEDAIISTLFSFFIKNKGNSTQILEEIIFYGVVIGWFEIVNVENNDILYTDIEWRMDNVFQEVVFCDNDFAVKTLLTQEGEIPEYPDELFALDFYKEYISQGGISPSYDQCIGYKVPLFLGGLDDLSNIEQIDFDVFWTLMTQLW